jgi:hypothetical protein
MRGRKFNFPPLPLVDCGGKMRPTKIPLPVDAATWIPNYKRQAERRLPETIVVFAEQ